LSILYRELHSGHSVYFQGKSQSRKSIESIISTLFASKKAFIKRDISFINPVPEFTREYLTVRSAAEISGYNQQYLRRLLRKEVLRTRKIGQIWLIDQGNFALYLYGAKQSKDQRF